MLSLLSAIFALCLGAYSLILRASSLELFMKMKIELPWLTQVFLSPGAIEGFLLFQFLCVLASLVPIYIAKYSSKQDGEEPESGGSWLILFLIGLSLLGACLIILSFKLPLRTIGNIVE